LDYEPDQVIVSSGCKQVLFNAMAVTLDPGDEVLLPLPYWMSYPAMVRVNRGTPVFLTSRPEDGFKLQPEVLEKAISPRTKWLFINSPNNPSGAVYSESDLSRLAEVLMRHPSVWILSDDIYEFLVFGRKKFVSLLNVAPRLSERTLVVNGFSKTFCVPGWRVGYGAGPVDLIKGMFKIQTQSTSGANILAQYAGVAALTGEQGFLEDHLDEYHRRRDMMVSMINRIEGLSCHSPEGAFYCLVSNAAVMGRKTPSGSTISTDEDWVNYLLDEGVAVVPGEPFGLSSFFRISFAAGEKQLIAGCERIANACQKLS
jgi:aspartate aminotransferase